MNYEHHFTKSRIRLIAALITMILALITLTTPLQASSAAPKWETEVFTKIPSPGFPEGIAVSDDDTIYVGTSKDATINTSEGPSRVFAYDKQGNLKREYVIEGQEENKEAILAMALDGDGQLYIVDHHPSRIIRLNPKTGEQSTYTTFSDVAPCVDGQPTGQCSAESQDRPSYPDDLAFAPDGSLYVTDVHQALIWRVPAGGGTPEVFYTHPDLDSEYGPNGIRFIDNGKTLLFAQTLHGDTPPEDLFNGFGRMYKLPIQSDGTAGTHSLFWEGESGELPDGFAVSESGNVYVVLAVPGTVMVLSPDGEEIRRTPSSEENAQLETPYNAPAGVAFIKKDIYITNHAPFGGPRKHHVVFKMKTDEFGKPLFRPVIPAN